MYTRRTDEYDLRTIPSRRSRSEDGSPPTLYTSAAYDGGPTIYGSSFRRRLGAKPLPKWTYPYKPKKKKPGSGCNLSRIEWMLLTATIITGVAAAILFGLLFYVDEDKLEAIEQRWKDKMELASSGGVQMLSYMQPMAEPCHYLYEYSCGHALSDPFLDSDVITKIENVPLKYNHERVFGLLREQIYNPNFMKSNRGKNFLQQYFTLCEKFVVKMRENSSLLRNRMIQESIFKSYTKFRETIERKSFEQALTLALTAGIYVFMRPTLSQAGVNNHDRFFGPTSEIVVTEKNETTDPYMIDVLDRYFAQEYLKNMTDLRKNISIISSSLKKGMHNFTMMENDCNRILYAANNSVPLDYISKNTAESYSFVLPFYRFLRFGYNGRGESGTCMKDKVFNQMSQMRPKEYAELIVELMNQFPDPNIWIEYIKLQVLLQQTFFLSFTSSNPTLSQTPFQQCLSGTPLFGTSSYFSVLMSRFLLPENKVLYGHKMLLYSDTLTFSFSFILRRMKMSLKYAPASEQKTLVDKFLSSSTLGLNKIGGKFNLYEPQILQLLWNRWIEKSEEIFAFNNIGTLQFDRFSAIYLKFIWLNGRTEIDRVVSLNYIRRLEIAPWTTKATMVCDELHIPTGAVSPWLDQNISMFEIVSGFIYFITEVLIESENLILGPTMNMRSPLKEAFYKAFNECLDPKKDNFHLYPLALLGDPSRYYKYFEDLDQKFSKYKNAEWFHVAYVQNFCMYRPLSIYDDQPELDYPYLEDIFKVNKKLARTFNCIPQRRKSNTTRFNFCDKMFNHWLDE